MPAGIEIYNYVTNQKGSPAIWSDPLANRPPAGFIGRLFVSIDTFEIYRDNGTGWDLIGSGGGGVNIYNSDGSLLTNRQVNFNGNELEFFQNSSLLFRINSGGADPKIISFQSSGRSRINFEIDGLEIGSNQGGNFSIRTYTDAGALLNTPFNIERRTGAKNMLASRSMTNGAETLTGAYNITTGTFTNVTMSGGNPHGANHNNYTLVNNGLVGFNASIFLGAQSNVLRLQSGTAGSITMQNASPGIRAACANLNQIQYNTANGQNLTINTAAVQQQLGIYRLSASGSLTITNAYGILINDLNEYSYANLILTNRWGIYQDSITDINYFGGTTLIGTITNAGYKLDVNGTIRSQDAVTIQNNTAPASSTDAVKLYGSDIVAGNSALHVKTENGAVVKIYQETTAVASATINHLAGGTAIKSDDTFDGYTLKQVVKALRNQGLLN